jgi:hypothetical protein
MKSFFMMLLEKFFSIYKLKELVVHKISKHNQKLYKTLFEYHSWFYAIVYINGKQFCNFEFQNTSQCNSNRCKTCT